MADLTGALQAAAGTAASAGGAADPNFNQTVLLLHGDGTNGAQNNTFLDSSTNNFTITRNGNTTQGTFSPFSVAEGQWSNQFSGSGAFLNWASNTAFVFGTGDFTIEAFVYATGLAGSNTTIMGTAAASEANCCVIGTNGSKFLRIQNNSTAFITDSVAFPEHQWVHICAVRSGTTLSLYKNGVRVGTAVNSTSFTSGTGPYVGGDTLLADFPGYISNARFVKGVAVYDPSQTTLTVPTAPLTAISGTSLLTCQSNRYKDNSTNNFVPANITGTISVQPFSPFAPSAAYSTSVNGGSGYFDGTGDYLETPSSSDLAFGTGDFCVEFWIYRTVAGQDGIYSNSASVGGGDAQFEIQVNASNKVILIGWLTTFMTSSASLGTNAWSHVAVVRSGTSMAIFINGNREATATSSNNFSSTNTFYIGAQRSSAANPVTGYISNLRAVKGASVYDPAQTTITIPTAPLTAVSGTELLCNFTNAGIFDNTGKNNLETVGNAQIDTATKKYGTGSLEFDGTGDSLVTVFNSNFVFGTGDFTVEYWYKSTATAASILHPSTTGSGYWSNFINTSTFWWQSSNQTTNLKSTSATSIIDGNWHHIAVVRASGTMNFYFDGTVQGSGTSDTTNYSGSAGTLRIGASGGYISDLNGLIDDLRITKGVARYTANFTPPTAPFPDQ